MMNPITFPDDSRSILAIPNSLLAHFGAEPRHETLPELDRAIQGKKKIAWILLDGLGSVHLRAHLPESAFLRTNTIATVTSVFPPTTVAATASCYSAQSPIEHGWLGWHMLMKECATDVTAFTSEGFYTGKRVAGPPPVPQALNYLSLFEQIRTVNPDARLTALSPMPAMFERGADEHIRYRDLDQGLSRLRTIDALDSPALTMLYYQQPDAIQHSTGTDSMETRRTFRDLNEKIESIAARLNDTMLIISSDHGLTNVSEAIDIFQMPDLMETLILPPSLESRAAAMFIHPHRVRDFERIAAERFPDFLWAPREKARALLGKGNPNPRIDDFLGSGVLIATGSRAIECSLPNHPPRDALKARHSGLTKEEMLVDVIVRDCRKDENHAF